MAEKRNYLTVKTHSTGVAFQGYQLKTVRKIVKLKSKWRKYFVENSFSKASESIDKKVQIDSRLESEAGKQHEQDGFHPPQLFSIFTSQKQTQIQAPKK